MSLTGCHNIYDLAQGFKHKILEALYIFIWR